LLISLVHTLFYLISILFSDVSTLALLFYSYSLLASIICLGNNISCRVDSSSGSVGRRYARSDELGIPFGITIDFQTLIDQSVTIRDRDSMSQIRVPIRNLLSLIQSLIHEEITWEYATKRFMIVKTGGEDDEDEDEGTSGGEGKKKESKASTSSAGSTSSLTIQSTARGSFSRPAVASK
jgi:hypothetical protein